MEVVLINICLDVFVVLWVQAAALLQGLLIRKPEQRLTASKAQHIIATLSDSS